MIDTRPFRTIRLTAGQHAFYDSFVVVLAAAAALRQAYVAHLEGKAVKYDPDDSASIQGMSHVTGVRLYYRPADVLNPLAEEGWPRELVFFEQPLGAERSEPSEGVTEYRSAKGFRGVTVVMMRAAFIGYYEAVQPTVHFGDQLGQWPPVWRFGRIVRNGLTHDGRIDIRNPSAAAESWRSFTYSPADNGKPLLFHDLAIPELLYLMIEMQGAK